LISRLYRTKTFKFLSWLPNRYIVPPANLHLFSSTNIYRIRPSTIPNSGNGLFDNTGLKVPLDTTIADYYGVILREIEYRWCDDRIRINTGMHLGKKLKKGADSLSVWGFPKLPASSINHKPFAESNCYFHLDVTKWDQKNQVFYPGFLSIKTFRPVKPFEEFFVCYGRHADDIINM